MDHLNEIRRDLQERINRSGTVLYSSEKTLRPGKFLILGLNPGGKDDENVSTIDKSLTACYADDYNAYTNENWDPYKKGEHPIQKNLIKLFAELGEDINNVCATNLIYERTSRETQLDSGHFKFYQRFLLKILAIVNPETIIVFGKKPFLYVRSCLTAIESSKVECAGHGSWVIHFVHGTVDNRKLLIIGLPHLSRYALYNHNDKIELIKNACKSFSPSQPTPN